MRNFEVFDSRSIMVSRSEFDYQDVWIMAACQFAPSLFALLGSGYALVNKDWLQISLTLLESVRMCAKDEAPDTRIFISNDSETRRH